MESKNTSSPTMLNGYWTPMHDRAFEEFPRTAGAENLSDEHVRCMKCDGHGGWNLSEMFTERTRPPEFRFFRAHCTICEGHGTLHKVHDRASIALLVQCGGNHQLVDIGVAEARKLGLPTYRCTSAHKCVNCGFAQSFDCGD
jgi:hypothetical protein